MGEKSLKLSFRCDAGTHDTLRRLGFERRASIQQLLEEAVEQMLRGSKDVQGSPGTELPPQLAGTAKKELDFLGEVVYFLRHAPPEFIANVRGLVASMNKMARREQRDETRKAG